MKAGSEYNAITPDDRFFHHKFDDLEELVKRFDSAERDEWQMPEKVIGMLDLPVEATVVEVGAGTGYFAVRLARHLRKGKVVALDKEPKLVAYLEKRAEDLGLKNMEARLAAEAAGSGNPAANTDLLLSVDMYHHLPDRVSYFSKFIEYLKPNGKLVVIDRRTDSPGSQSNNRISPEAVKAEMREAGFNPVKEFDFLPYQYFLVFEKAEAGEAL
jgi:cyclopropane fatty-acyl-phospholipid synthase-like methyltransferase